MSGMNPMWYPIGMIYIILIHTATIVFVVVVCGAGVHRLSITSTRTSNGTMIGFGLCNFVGMMWELQINPPGMYSKQMCVLKLP